MERSAIGLLLVKAESTYGTDPTPTNAANLIPVEGAATFSAASTRIERKILDGTHDRVAGFNALPNVTLKFRYAVRGNRTDGSTADISAGASANKIEIDGLLQAADLSPNYTAESSGGARDGNVIYKPVVPTSQSGMGSSVTCYFQTELKKHAIIGGKVDFEVMMEAGKMAYIDFTIRGKYVAITDNSLSTSSAAWLDIKPPLFTPSVLTLGSYTPIISTLKFGVGNDIQMRENAVATTGEGIEGFVIVDKSPKGEFNPESVAEATNPFWAAWRASTVATLTATFGSATGNKFSAILSTELTDVNYSDLNKRRVHSAKFDILKSALSSTAGGQLQLKWF